MKEGMTMREIRIRGKRVDNGEWIDSRSIIDFDDSVFIARSVDVDCRHDEAFTKIVEMNSGEIPFLVRVKPETVGQYTGVTDKNGKKIFEGDIVDGLFLYGDTVKGIVTFQEGSFGVEWKRGDVAEFSPFTSCCNVEWSVVGNIHDNPELLKGGEDK